MDFVFKITTFILLRKNGILSVIILVQQKSDTDANVKRPLFNYQIFAKPFVLCFGNLKPKCRRKDCVLKLLFLKCLIE